MLLESLEAGFLKDGVAEDLVALLVDIDSLGDFFLKLEVRLAYEIRKDGLDSVYALVILVLVKTRIGNHQVKHLECGLDIFHGRIRAEGLPELADAERSGYLLAGKHLAYGSCREAGDTAVLVEESKDIGIETWHVLDRNGA